MTLEKMDKNIKKKKKIPSTNVDNVNKIIINVPTQDAIQKKYINTQSAYLTNTRQVVSATTKGIAKLKKLTVINLKKKLFLFMWYCG